MHTDNCVYCGEKATNWCGFVLANKKKILAGWCKKHNSQSKVKGFTGHYDRWMKIRKES